MRDDTKEVLKWYLFWVGFTLIAAIAGYFTQ